MSAIDWNKPIEPVLDEHYTPGATAKLLHTLTGPGAGPYPRVVLVHYGDGSEGVLQYNDSGTQDLHRYGPVLRNVLPPVEKRQYWVNIYPGKGSFLHTTERDANIRALEHRIACVPVTVEFRPGDGL